MTEIKPLKFGLTAVYIPREAPPPRRPYCGSPTKTGDECRNRVSEWGALCSIHEADYPW